MGTPRRSGWLVLLMLGLLALVAPAAGTTSRSEHPTAHRLVAGLQGGSGSTIGPDGALYVTEGVAGRITRIDPKTGATTTYASGLPKRIVANGGPMDIAFLGRTAYVLVTLVGPDVGGSDVVGIYRVDGPDSFTVVADIGAFSIANPPATSATSPRCAERCPVRAAALSWRVPGDRWQPQPGAAGHPRRADQRAASVRQHRPDRTGGPGQDHLHGRGRPRSPPARGRQGGGVPAQVDHRCGKWHRAVPFSLTWSSATGTGCTPCPRAASGGNPAGSPALPNTGALVKASRDGTFTVVIDRLNQPTSLEFIRKTAYVVTLGGEVWKIRVCRVHPPRLGVSNGAASWRWVKESNPDRELGKHGRPAKAVLVGRMPRPGSAH